MRASADRFNAALNAAGVPHFYWMYGRPGPSAPYGCDGGHNFGCWNFAFLDAMPRMLAVLQGAGRARRPPASSTAASRPGWRRGRAPATCGADTAPAWRTAAPATVGPQHIRLERRAPDDHRHAEPHLHGHRRGCGRRPTTPTATSACAPPAGRCWASRSSAASTATRKLTVTVNTGANTSAGRLRRAVGQRRHLAADRRRGRGADLTGSAIRRAAVSRPARSGRGCGLVSLFDGITSVKPAPRHSSAKASACSRPAVAGEPVAPAVVTLDGHEPATRRQDAATSARPLPGRASGGRWPATRRRSPNRRRRAEPGPFRGRSATSAARLRDARPAASTLPGSTATTSARASGGGRRSRSAADIDEGVAAEGRRGGSRAWRRHRGRGVNEMAATRPLNPEKPGGGHGGWGRACVGHARDLDS